MKIEIYGFYQSRTFTIAAIGDSLFEQIDVSEAEMWEVISYLLYHPHYVVTHYSQSNRTVQFACVYDQSAKARQIAESNRHFERMRHG